MLKFFRKYNKWLLVIGGGLLMIVFLIQPVMSMFQADPNSFVLGEYDGGELTRGEVRNAMADMQVIQNFGLFLDPDRGSESDDAIRWALILKDAERLGLSASLTEVEQIKLDAGRSPADVENIAARMSATPGYINHALRNWLIVQRYKELLAGQSHTPGIQRAAFSRQMRINRESAGVYQAMAYGTSRMSKPLVEHFLQDQGSQVTGRVVLIKAENYLNETPTPSEEQVQTLFEKYKDSLPGQGEPYGFGYRVPNRVKLEYLAISMDEAQRHVKITEADALAYHRQHPDQYKGEGESAQVKPYEAVREQVIQDLSLELAFGMVEKMAKAAFGSLYEDTRGMDKIDDYRVVGDLAKLRSMRQVADQLEAEYGFRPDVNSGGGGWVNAQELSGLPGIGQSRLADNLNVPFTTYVLSAKELKPESDNPLLPRRLQIGLAGAPMMDMNGSRYVFRLTAAEPTRVPESLDEVREQVTQDAWHLAAYEKLLESSDARLKQAVDGGLQAVASHANTTVVDLPATARRIPLPNGLLIVPPLPGVGQSDEFIEAFFATANHARAKGELDNAAAEDVTGVIGIDPRLSLAVYRVDDYQPMTRALYQANAASPLLPVIIDTTVLAPARIENPLSLAALTERLNFTYGEADDEEAADSAKTPKTSEESPAGTGADSAS